jgi:hypothetical protein
MQMPLASRNRRSENVRVLAIVIAELELCNIEWKVLTADLVERADHTAFEDRPEALNRVGVDRADHILTGSVIDNRVLREALVETLVADPLIGDEKADLLRDAFANKAGESVGPNIGEHAGHHIPLAADGASDGGFARASAAGSVTAAALVDVPVLGKTSDESFIDFDNASELLEIATSQCRTDTVTHIPSGVVGAEAHHPLNLQRANALLAGQHHMDDAKPVAERLIRVLEDGPGDMGEAIARIGRASVALPTPGHRRDAMGDYCPTTRAADAIWPAPSHEVSATGILIGKHLLKLADRQLVNGFGLFCSGHGGSPYRQGGNYHV